VLFLLRTAVLLRIPHLNCCKIVPNRPLRGRRGRFGTLLQLLECGIFLENGCTSSVRRRWQRRLMDTRTLLCHMLSRQDCLACSALVPNENQMLLARLFLLQPERPPDCSLVTAVDWSERKSQRDLDTSNQVVWPGECMNTTSCFVPFCAHRSVGG